MMGYGALARQQTTHPEPLPVTMIETPTMVLKTGELFELQWQKRNQVPACRCGPHGDRPIYSTGLLERALATGLDAWVLMSRTRLEPYDAWWADPLPADHVIFPSAGPNVTLHEAEYMPWVTLAVALQLPHEFLTSKDRENMPRSRLDIMAGDWMLRRFCQPAAIREWLHCCGVSFASDMRHPATQRSG